MALNITVTTTEELIAAINTANNEQVNPGPDLINLVPNTIYSLTQVNNNLGGENGLPLITSEIIIDGNGAIIERADNAAATFRILQVANNGNLTLNNLTIRKGVADDGDRNNFLENPGSNGGGILNFGTLRVSNTQITDNRASVIGGGISNLGNAQISNSTFSNNIANNNGGGLSNIGSLLLNNSTFVNNIAEGPFSRAGAISNEGVLQVVNSTITGNIARGPFTFGGGGLYNTPAPFAIGPGIISIANSIIAGNQSIEAPDVYGPVNSQGYNLIGDGSSSTFAFTYGINGDLVGTADKPLDPLLGSLTNNGGLTPTVALLPESPALNAGNPNNFPSVDQRGLTRPQASRSDIGALEAGITEPIISNIFINDAVVSEGNSGTTNLEFTVFLPVAISQVVTVNYSTADGTAKSGQDYQSTNGTITFNPGETSKIISVPINGDTIPSPNKNLFVNLSNPSSNARIADSQGLGLILTDDLVENPQNVQELIAAIEAANNELANPGLQTINLTPGAIYSLTDIFYIDEASGYSGLPLIRSDININGNGAIIERASTANSTFRIFQVDALGNLTLNGVNLLNGLADLDKGFGDVGGAILNYGNLQLINSEVSNSTAAAGGGIYNLGPLEVTNSTFVNNQAISVFGFGGAIRNQGLLNVTSSTFVDNFATSSGGAIANGGGTALRTLELGTLAVSNSTFARNRAEFGGGLYNGNFTPVPVANSIVVGNSANEGGDVFGSFNSLGYNLIADNTGSTDFNKEGDMLVTDSSFSLYFDEQYYRQKNVDVNSGISSNFFTSAAQHFTEYGWLEGRNPGLLFNSKFYLQNNTDVQISVNTGQVRSAFEHFIKNGRAEGRDSSTLFNSSYYLEKYSDVRVAIANGSVKSAWEHFYLYGQFENRNPSLYFNNDFYLAKYSDVRLAIAQGFVKNAWEHFTKFGQFEKRDPSLRFDTNFYLANYSDINQALEKGQIYSAFEHYLEYGQYENRIAAFIDSTGDVIVGTDQDDVLYAGAGGDYLIAGDGKDVLIAGPGNDILEGGAGIDQFIFQAAFEGKGGYGGQDVITDYEAIAGTGDIIKLRNANNGTQINIFDAQGNAVIQIVNSLNIDFTKGGDPATPSGTGNFAPLPIQSITLLGVTAAQLMTQGILEINERRINEATPGIVKAFGSYSYTVSDVAGNSVFGGPQNNLIAGDFISQEQINTLRAKLEAITEIVIPGAAESTDPSVNLGGTGRIPESLLPREAFKDLVPTFDKTTVNNDLAVGGPGNDLIFGGPGSDTLVGGPGVDVIIPGPGSDFVIGRESVDYIVYDSILDFRDRDNNPEDPVSNAVPDGRIGYIRLEEPYGTILTDPNTTRTGPDIFLVNSQAFNRGIDPTTNPELAAQIGYLTPGTMISGDGTGTAAMKNGQLKVGSSTVPTSDGPAEDSLQPTFYYSSTAGRLFYDRDGIGTQFGDFWMADMAPGIELPPGTPSAVPTILIYVY